MFTKRSLCLLAAIVVSLSTAASRVGRIDRDDDASEDTDDLRERIYEEVLAYPKTVDTVQARIEAASRLDSTRFRKLEGVPSGTWRPLGPTPALWFGVRAGAWTDSIAVDPRDANTVYIGNPGSGVWRTKDGGTHWIPMTDSAPALGIGAVAIAPSRPDIVYAGTGNWWDGIGLLKSVDGGNQWGLFAAVPCSGAIFRAIAVNPVNPDVLLAGVRASACASGLYLSADGGQSWRPVLAPSRSLGATGIAWHPSDQNIVYAAMNTGIFRSVDGGRTWNVWSVGIDPSLFQTALSVQLVLAEASPNVLYAVIAGPLPTARLGAFRSADGGSTWTQLPVPADNKLWDSQPIAVSPKDPNLVVIGGDRLYRSLDGGHLWDNITCCPGTFGDYRALSFSADGTYLYIGDDGGVFKTVNPTSTPVSWIPLNDTLDTALFYLRRQIAVHPINPNVTLGGAQDLGVLLYSGAPSWTSVVNCDGGTALIDPANPLLAYATCQGPALYKSTTGGSSGWQLAMQGINTSDSTLFVPPLAIDPQNSQRLLFGTYRLYESRDSAATWSAISGDVSGCGGVNAITISPLNSDVVYAGSNCGRVYVSTNATSPSAAWTNRSSGSFANRPITSVVADPRDARTAYVTVGGFTGRAPSGHIFRTTDAGSSWTDVSGDLPDIPTNHVLIDPDVTNAVYLATDVGVFFTQNGGGTWVGLSNGLPHAYVQSLALFRPSRALRASTFGRGLWELALNGSSVGIVQQLLPGESVQSKSARYRLTYQADGNLVFIDDMVQSLLWSTNTAAFTPGRAVMQGDGNFVVYDAGGTARWTSGTAGNPGAYAIVQDDGNFVILRTDGTLLWDRHR